MGVMFWVWLGVFVVSALVEVITMDLVSVWFAVGAIIPFILSVVYPDMYILQISIFVVLSALMILLLRKFAVKWMFRHSDGKTNINSNEGKSTRLLQDITLDDPGMIKLGDITWFVVSEDGNPIKKGQFVEVVKAKGNKLVVKLSGNLNEKDKKINSNEETVAEEKGE